jgi:hypothetical protein
VLQASFFGGDSESVTRSSNALIQAVVASGEFSHKTKVSRDGTDEVRACCVTQWHFLASSSNCLCTFVAGEVTGRTNNTEDTTLSPARHPNQGTNSVLSPTARSRNIIHVSLYNQYRETSTTEGLPKPRVTQHRTKQEKRNQLQGNKHCSRTPGILSSAAHRLRDLVGDFSVRDKRCPSGSSKFVCTS